MKFQIGLTNQAKASFVPSGKVIIKLFVFCGREVFLILMLILVKKFGGFWPQTRGSGEAV